MGNFLSLLFSLDIDERSPCIIALWYFILPYTGEMLLRMLLLILKPRFEGYLKILNSSSQLSFFRCVVGNVCTTLQDTDIAY